MPNESKDDAFWTPLMEAAYNGQAEVVAYFLDEHLFPTGAESAQVRV